jgi:MFS family permease
VAVTDAERLPAERWNFATLLVQAVARRVANELSSEKLVLPFLYTALGGAVLFAGLFTPVVVVARLLAQLFGARLVEITRQGKGFLAACTAVTAAVLVCLAGFRGDLPTALLPVVFVAASVFLGMSNGFGALVFQDMIGRILGERPRISLLFAIGAGSGFLVIVATVISQLVAGFSPTEKAAADHIHLIWTSAGILAVSTLAALAVRDSSRAVPAATPSTVGESYIGSLYQRSRTVLRLAWFRRFVLARVLFMSVEMMTPFFAVHAATFHAGTAPSLSMFVIAVSLGMIGGGLVWPQVSKRSIQLVLSLSSLVACLAAMLAFVNHVVEGVQSPYLHAAMIFCLAFATQGTLDGSTAYVVGSSTDEQRPYCIAVSNLAAGIVGIGLALGAGTISHFRGVIVGILVMGALNLAAAAYAMTLRDVQPGGSDLRSAG